MSADNLTLECLPNGTIPLRVAFGDLIPNGIPFIIVPGNNTEARYMTECCAPNKVNLVIGCYMWCEIPDRYLLRNGDSDIHLCISDNGWPENNDSTVLYMEPGHDSESGAGRVVGRMGVMGLGVWGLLLAGFLSL
ncbi:hypothetical protein B0I37DRAFT_163831 [Chaetomium sp. MPI-CAGE-AT-0009]|nr:hypothetical protein B0I37DRAFT_163831 [Chaetomium sp. MPI-CAGE-AT-0009]